MVAMAGSPGDIASVLSSSSDSQVSHERRVQIASRGLFHPRENTDVCECSYNFVKLRAYSIFLDGEYIDVKAASVF